MLNRYIGGDQAMTLPKYEISSDAKRAIAWHGLFRGVVSPSSQEDRREIIATDYQKVLDSECGHLSDRSACDLVVRMSILSDTIEAEIDLLSAAEELRLIALDDINTMALS